ncbi:MAG TPA: HNH endonuclease [Patescibacteria group bacterium]
MSDIPIKKCTGACGQEYPATIEYWHRKNGGKYGFCAKCKACVNEEKANQYSDPEKRNKVLKINKNSYHKPDVHERILAQKKEYSSQPEVKTHRETYNKEYYTNNKEYIQNQHKGYYNLPEIKEHRKNQSKKYLNRPDIREHKQNYRKTYMNRPGMKAHRKAYIEKYYNRPGMKERKKAYMQKYLKEYMLRPGIRERMYAIGHAYRARKKSIKGTHTPQQIQDQLKRQKHKCYYCQKKFNKIKGQSQYHIEHTFPISRVAGTDIPANSIEYLVLACPTCNTSKGNKFPWEWPQGGRLL